MVCAGAQLEPGKKGIFAGFCRYSFSWSLEKSWYVPVFFLLAVGEKLIFQKTLPGVVICANENWVALLFQDSLVLCSVKCKGWPFGTILVWRLGPLPRLAKVLSGLFFGRARAWSDQTTQRETCGSFSPNTNDKRQKTKLLAFVPPPQVSFDTGDIGYLEIQVPPCWGSKVKDESRKGKKLEIYGTHAPPTQAILPRSSLSSHP